jgi:hypothetical protein
VQGRAASQPHAAEPHRPGAALQFLYDLLGLQPGRTHLQLLTQHSLDLQARRDAGEPDMDDQVREADAAVAAELALGHKPWTRAQAMVALAIGIAAAAVVVASNAGLVRALSAAIGLTGLGSAGWAWRRLRGDGRS